MGDFASFIGYSGQLKALFGISVIKVSGNVCDVALGARAAKETSLPLQARSEAAGWRTPPRAQLAKLFSERDT